MPSGGRCANQSLAFLLPIVLVLLLAFSPGIAAREDLGRHLLLGRLISEQRHVPDVNLLTYTHPDFPFTNHHWLSEVVLYQLHRVVGLNGWIAAKMVLATAALAIALVTRPPRHFYGAYCLAGIAAAVLLGYRSDIRPELFTFVFVALYGWLLPRIRLGRWGWERWAAIGIAWAWANLHIYFVFGLGMAGAFALERCWSAPSRDTWRRELAWLAALLIATCLGPNGIGGLLYPFQIFSNYGVDVAENSSPVRLAAAILNPMLLLLPWYSVAVAWAAVRIWLTSGKERIADVILAAAALVSAWTMARNVALLALIGLPLIGAALSIPSPTRRSRSPLRLRLRAMASPLATTVAILLGLTLVHSVVEGRFSRMFPPPGAPSPPGLEGEGYYGRLSKLFERFDLRGPVFTDYDIGSLVEYEIYPLPGYADARPEAFPASFWRGEAMPALELGEVWDSVSRRRGFNVVVVSFRSAAFIAGLSQRPEWVLVAIDDLAAVFVRNHPPNAEILREARLDRAQLDSYEAEIAARIAALPQLPWWRRAVEAERLVYRLYGLTLIGEAGALWPQVASLHAQYPDYHLVHELLPIAAPASEAGLVMEQMSRNARWPVSAKQVLDWATVLARAGRFDDARAALTRGRRFFPLSNELRQALEYAS